MALNNVSFTNNAGSMVIYRPMISFSYRYVWSGSGSGRITTTVNITGSIKKTEDQISNILSSSGAGGTLVLPNATMSGMYIVSASHQEGTWSKWGKISIGFNNEFGEGKSAFNGSSITWYGYTLYVPKISVSPSTIRKSETVVHGVDGYLRQQLGYTSINAQITGVLRCNDASLPAGFLDTLEKRNASNGYPSVFNLSSAVPEVSGNFDLRQCVVKRGITKWHMSKRFADVTIEIIAPPQTITV